MIPYFQYNTILLGPVTIQVWGLMVALGIIASLFVMRSFAKRYFLSEEVLYDMAVWVLVSSFVFARLFHILFYNLDFYLLNPADVFKIWQGGASSTGGFFGAALALWLFAKKRGFTFQQFVPYMDVAAVSLWLGWGIGRIGCFLIHDHPGTLTHFVGGVQFPGGARHDLGLYESIVGFVLFLFSALLFKRLVRRRWGLVTLVSVTLYAIARFFLDFLRATDITMADARYAHLTPAQWGMLVLVLASFSVLTTSFFAKKPVV
jgi:phosphatidylglycerol:prolipoprotein diacylglycerol transferase